MASLFEYNELETYVNEFNTLIDLPSQNGMTFKGVHAHNTTFDFVNYSLNELLNESRIYYAFLKAYEYNNIVDYFEELLIIDSSKATKFLAGMGKFIIDQRMDAFKSDRIFSFESLTDFGFDSFDLMGKQNKNYEIGKFLFKKLTFMPEGFEACKCVIDRYKQEDLYKVSASLHKGINESNIDLINKTKIELSDILDNVWTDARLEKRIAGLKCGIPFILGTVGYLALDGVGLFAGLGLTAVSEFITANQESIGEKFARKTVSDYVVNIYDFKTKYDIE